ncbi:neuronal PAS domain-containing protein 1 [Denticeps clupeoides]|uniref:neuronal PAS domain-containing protein 1 n=1 Tax=Denticeps clupeoides TaxID=299321 RepID=UPI0010A40489|nr:neuronal PAS domain-containing protein 1 [Denticeps clupeoides]XP_028818777.1 neuronal PAS domain-containing protein 1 [Denticeps clupeoides]XP_028818778.1 neuronal PAS domain-containing protein 1 [Denticeps clupeoides]
MASMPFVSEGKCVSVEWDFLQGLLAKPPTLPCLQNLRKEKSRNAARSRRGKENFEFFELAKMLPLPGAITSQLDKASVIRLTISYLHMRHFASQGDPPWSPLLEGEANCNKVRRTTHSLATDIFEQHLGAHLLQSLDGFVFVVSQEGRFLYISETVSIYLGLSQVELTGSSVFDYIHPADHVEMAERLGIRPHLRAEAGCQTTNESASSSASTSSLAGTPEPAPSSPHATGDDHPERGFFIRMKSTLTKRGLHVKSSGYKVIHVTGRIRSRPTLVPGSTRSLHRPMGLVALAHTLPPSTLNEVRMESHMFVFRVNMDLQVTYCENRISEYMDLSPAEVVGHTCYRFIHVEDLDSVRQSHEDLLRKGQVVTGYYRWLQRRGGFLWVQSCATVSINHKAPHERNVIWVNYILSRTEMADAPLDLLQLPESLRAERLRANSSPHDVSPKAQGSASLKAAGGKKDPDHKVRDGYTHTPAGQSQERRKRPRPPNADEGPPEMRRRVEEFSEREESASLSSGSDSEAEEEGKDSEWDNEGEVKRVKPDEGRLRKHVGTGVNAGERSGKIHNGRAVIQQLKRAVTALPPSIKTEQETNSSTAAGGRWSHSQPPLHSASSSLNGSSPPASLVDSESPSKALYPPTSPPTLSPPLRVEERGSLGPHGGRAPDFELLQRLASAGGAAGRVLFHPLALGPQGPQSLYAPSTIRYAPPELPPSHPAAEGLRADHPAAKPPASFFPHLQRITALPPFSGFSATEPHFSAGLPFCMNGLRGAAGPEED